MKTAQWTAVVLTCQNQDSAHAFQRELKLRQLKGVIAKDVLLLTVEDPKARVGSGGATLNALLVVAEHLSAQSGYTVVNADVLQDVRILIMHMGRNYPYDNCGKVFTTLPAMAKDSQYDQLMCNLDFLIDTVSNKIAVDSPPGIWVCSTDMFLSVPENMQANTATLLVSDDICAITVPGKPQDATQHGIYNVDSQGYVSDILYQGDASAIQNYTRPDGSVLMVVGLVYLSPRIAEQLLSFHTQPPLDACTYMGLDSGAQPTELSLFFDFMLPMCSDVTESTFINGDGRKDTPARANTENAAHLKMARRLLWKRLNKFKLKAVVIEGSHFNYLSPSASGHLTNLLHCPLQECNKTNVVWRNAVYAHIKAAKVGNDTVVINSVIDKNVVIGDGCAISHCDLSGDVTIGNSCMLNTIYTGEKEKSLGNIHIKHSTVLQGYHIQLKSMTEEQYVVTVHGSSDDIMTSFSSDGSTFCNLPWANYFSKTGITAEDLWPKEMSDDRKCLFTARLYPVLHPSRNVGLQEALWLQDWSSFGKELLERWRCSWRLSLEEILPLVNLSVEFEYRRSLFFKVGELQVKEALLDQGDRETGLVALFNSTAVEGHHQQILERLDTVASESTNPGLAARTLANIADVLGCMAQNKGGLRSGPAANKEWKKAFMLLEQGDHQSMALGVRALAKVRSKWLDRPDHLIRAARHYEGAAAILIRHAVMTARQFINVQASGKSPLPRGTSVIARCPARLDLSGGWSDTPPITYEHGGAVTNVAIMLDGKKPVGAKCQMILEPSLVLVIGGSGDASSRLVLKELHQLEDYNQPHAPGALLKAAFLCAEIVCLDGPPLEQQLMEKYGGGFELNTWSDLPHGSGLGTSSILAGAVMGALWTASGKSYKNSDLIHAVLHLEQMLTTGGGWQDQVGGLIGGVKIGHSKGELPLFVDATSIDVSPETIKNLNDRLILVYTGKTRLARNLLQNVIRNWYARDPDIINTEDQLVATAYKCAQAFKEGNLAEVGSCMNTYWIQKKKMATGCEPLVVRQMMDALKPHVYGTTLAGAGGGGFMYVLTKEANAMETVKSVLARVDGTNGISLHKATVDMEGMTVEIKQEL